MQKIGFWISFTKNAYRVH